MDRAWCWLGWALWCPGGHLYCVLLPTLPLPRGGRLPWLSLAIWTCEHREGGQYAQWLGVWALGQTVRVHSPLCASVSSPVQQGCYCFLIH